MPRRCWPTRWPTPTSRNYTRRCLISVPTPRFPGSPCRLPGALSHLRSDAPVSWVDVPNFRPFWAITKHADIMDIERDNVLFTNWPRPVLVTAEADETSNATGGGTLFHMTDHT